MIGQKQDPKASRAKELKEKLSGGKFANRLGTMGSLIDDTPEYIPSSNEGRQPYKGNQPRTMRYLG